jgi:hypothetical protein
MSPTYPLALGITLLTEGALMALAARLLKRPVWRWLLVCLGVNLVVHPIFWHTFRYVPGDWPVNLYLAEGLVALVEGLAYLILLRRGPLVAWGLSVGLNLASVVTGVLLFRAL